MFNETFFHHLEKLPIVDDCQETNAAMFFIAKQYAAEMGFPFETPEQQLYAIGQMEYWQSCYN